MGSMFIFVKYTNVFVCSDAIANGKRHYIGKIFNLNTIPEYLTKMFFFIVNINLIPTWPQVFLQF